MKSAILAILLLKALLAVPTKRRIFAVIVGTLLLVVAVLFVGSVASIQYKLDVKRKQLHEQWRQESLQYWKLKNALINIGIVDVLEVQDGLSEIRRSNGDVEYWRAP